MERGVLQAGAPPTAQATQLPVSGVVAPPRAPAQGVPWRPILPPEMTRKIKKWQCLNLAFTLLQLACSIAIIGIVSNQLQVLSVASTGPNTGRWTYACFAATSDHPSTCQYAYSLASISIFAGFIVSLMQCLTLDCCGAGRIIEVLFDGLAAAWWIAGAATLTNRATEANAQAIPQAGWRNAVAALAWVAAAAFLALCVINLALTSKLGKAYREAVTQHQAAVSQAQVGNGGAYAIQMAPTAYPAPAGGGGGAPHVYGAPTHGGQPPPGYGQPPPAPGFTPVATPPPNYPVPK